jgi:hypothetical protein
VCVCVCVCVYVSRRYRCCSTSSPAPFSSPQGRQGAGPIAPASKGGQAADSGPGVCRVSPLYDPLERREKRRGGGGENRERKETAEKRG